MKTKTFDCVEMKWRGAEQVQAETAGMTREQEVEYWRVHTEAFKELQREMVERKLSANSD